MAVSVIKMLPLIIIPASLLLTKQNTFTLMFAHRNCYTVGRVNFVRKKFCHIRNRYTNEKIERINLHTCALKTKFSPRPVSVEAKMDYLERETCVRGCHEYKAIWAAAEELECRREPTNLVRHLNASLQRTVSRFYSLWWYQSGQWSIRIGEIPTFIKYLRRAMSSFWSSSLTAALLCEAIDDLPCECCAKNAHKNI